MRFGFKEIGLILILAVISYGLALIWWRAWMYQGVFGPIPFFHWFGPSDGEASYSLTELEMFIHLFVVISSGYFLAKLKNRKSQDEN